MIVEVKNLVRHFGATHAVNDVTFTVASGQIYGFVGPNGAGKTTTMRIMATLDEPTEGDVLIDGVSVVHEPEHARRLIGYMPDALPMHRDMSVHDYIDFYARAYGLRNPKRREVVESIEEFTNLMGIRHKLINALSKGMKQRVSLARAMVHDPKLIIMDEPANGLDPRARIELRELLRVLREQGKAILISSHILTELAEIVDGAVIIERGSLLGAGDLKQILRSVATHQTVVIRALGKVEDLHKKLLEMAHVGAARMAGNVVAVDVEGGEEACGQLLETLVTSGVKVIEFKLEQANLENVFMQVTKGEVQ